MTGRTATPAGRECSLCGQVFFGRRFECPCRSKAEGRVSSSKDDIEVAMTPEPGREAARSSDCFHPFCAEHSPLMKATVRFWACPVDEHRDRRGVVTVEWREGVAHCTAPDCERTSHA